MKRKLYTEFSAVNYGFPSEFFIISRPKPNPNLYQNDPRPVSIDLPLRQKESTVSRVMHP